MICIMGVIPSKRTRQVCHVETTTSRDLTSSTGDQTNALVFISLVRVLGNGTLDFKSVSGLQVVDVGGHGAI